MGKDVIKKDAEEDDDDEPEDDERIDEIYEYAEKHNPEEVAAFIREKAEEGAATIEGSIFTDKLFFSAYFLLMATLDETEPLPPQVKEKEAFFKAWATDEECQEALMRCFEYFVSKKEDQDVDEFEGVLRPLWDLEVIPEEIMFQWSQDENLCRGFGVTEEDALAVREAARPFLEWCQSQ